MGIVYENEQPVERVILVGISERNGDDTESSLAELAELAATAGAEVVGTVIQNLEHMHPGTYVGTGKLEEIRDMIWEKEATGIICDDELSPIQMRNMEQVLDSKVMDRTLLILDIFAARARTSEGKIQVELAQLKYRASRLAGFGRSMSRLGGGIGTRGPGEKKLEIDRRLIGHRTAQLNRELKEVVRHRELTRSQRMKSHTKVAAIVGYTNAGKSTLLNTLTDADVLEEDQLFATLDPTTRMLELSNHQNLMLTDTVGFIRKLPHHLVDAFKSTLEEAKYADFIIHVVDASNPQWDAQMHVVYMTLQDLGVVDKKILTVFNKCDRITGEEILQDFRADKTLRISAKTGLNVEAVLEEIVQKIPAPAGDPEASLQALIFDSLYDSYKGVIVFCRVKNGTIKKGTRMKMMATGAVAEVVEVGYFGAGQFIPCEELSAGMVGYVTASIKNVQDTRVGDTITDLDNPCAEPLPGYKKVTPMVYCGLYPADGAKYPDLRDALEKLQLNDAALYFEPETSVALGFGFRCGFLGLLHLDIIQERLEREYNLDLVTTAPGVVYRVHKTNGDMIELTNPSNLPDPSEIAYMEEPIVSAEIMVTTEFVGAIMTLCQERRGVYLGMEYIEASRALLKYELPLNEIIYDFFDALKSRSRGYASFDYELKGYEESKLVKLDILVNREEVDALSFIVFEGSAYERGRKMCEKLKDEIPRHLFEIPIQAAVGGKIIARETVKAMRKDVLAKCYGGDISRKRKLLEKQKEGKKRMRQIGNVEIPQKAFMSVLKLDEE